MLLKEENAWGLRAAPFQLAENAVIPPSMMFYRLTIDLRITGPAFRAL
ncbi:hypothetical protein [Mycoplana dimorpha]|nr:hypothetical protein [Mycoplana dimorpha]